MIMGGVAHDVGPDSGIVCFANKCSTDEFILHYMVNNGSLGVNETFCGYL